MSSTRLKAEQRTIWTHTATVYMGQLAAMLFGVVDTLVAGRTSDTILAALSVGAAISISVTVGLMGVINILLPIYAEHRGAKRYETLGRTVHQGLYLTAVLSITACVLLNCMGPALELAQIPADIAPEIMHYLRVQSLVVPVFVLFRMYAHLNQALGKPWFVTSLQVGGLLLKIPLSVWFVHWFGLVGCAWASLLVMSASVAIGWTLIAKHPDYTQYNIWRKLDAPDWAQLKAYLRLGVPSGLSQLVEITSFTLISVLVARLGTTASGAHQIGATFAGLLFMFPISYGVAASARVSYWIGHGDQQLASDLVRQTLVGCLLASTICAVVVLLGRDFLAALFSKNPDVVGLAGHILVFIAFYHVADALQIVGLFLLRCYRITLMPLLVYSSMLWGFGIAGGYWLTYHASFAKTSSFAPLVVPLHDSPLGFWATAVVSLWLVASIFALTVTRKAKQVASV